MSLHEEVEKYARAHRDEEPLDVARRYIDQYSSAELAERLAEDVARAQRQAVSYREKAAFAELFDRTDVRPVEALQQPSAGVRALLKEHFSLGDGTLVEWGKATAEQHRQRARFLRVFAEGVIRTAERHELAAEAIEQAGVESLEEIGAIPVVAA